MKFAGIVAVGLGEAARAEPVAALFESGRARLAGAFPALEDELAGLTLAGGYEGPGRSPDRADAMVWAMSELVLTPPRAAPRVRRLCRRALPSLPSPRSGHFRRRISRFRGAVKLS